jgi:hypothetical protein
MKTITLLFTVLTIAAMPTARFPEATISNGLIQAKLYLPDSRDGYYQGTRFDWSGNMPSLKFAGHEYFGQWFTTYSPEIHDVIMGPVQEFTSLDFDNAHPDETFVKIGVGVLIKPDEKPYSFARYYQVANHGTWNVKTKPDQVQFIHELRDNAYSYRYEKVVQLIKDKPELELVHTIRNTGNKTIETSVYDHNFFVIDDQPVGPGYSITVPFRIKGTGEGIGELAQITDNRIEFLRNLKKGEQVFCSPLEGFGSKADDYEFRIENKLAGAGVKITCDQPILKLNFWCCSTTICPEPYILVKVEPGKEFTWKIHYEFYTLK